MNYWMTILLAVQVLSAIGVVILVLMQHGKGADMGAAFGSGASGSLFGATGAANFLSRFTAVLAAVFFVATAGLSYVASTNNRATNELQNLPQRGLPTQTVPAQPSVPAAPAVAPAQPSDIPK